MASPTNLSPDNQTVGGALAQLLAGRGVDRLFAVPGESGLELLDALEHETSVQVVSTRIEMGASFMADAHAKLTGRTAVAMAGRAVGATNLSLGVHTAHHDSTPMLVILGQVESNLLGRDAFQEIDLEAFYRPISKWAVTADRPDRVLPLVDKALHIARTGRPGPAVVVIPADVFGAAFPEAGGAEPVAPPTEPAGINPQSLALLRDELAAAERPVAILGGGARSSRDLAVRFSERFGVGVYAGFRRQDAFPNEHRNYLGHLATAVVPETLEALRNADLVVVLGSRLGEITSQRYTLPAASSRVIQVDVEPASLGTGMPVDHRIQASVGATLEALLDGADEGETVERDWSASRTAFEQAVTFSEETEPSARPNPASVMRAVNEHLPADAIVTSDAGNFSVFVHRYLPFTGTRSQLAPTNGAMGYGAPAAVAAKLAHPDRPVVSFLGDGGFLMTGNEFETARRFGAPIVFIVLQNGLYGTIAGHQENDFGRLTAVGIGPLDLAGYAKSLGGDGFTVNTEGELADAISAAFDSDLPTVVDVRTDPDILLPGRMIGAGLLDGVLPAAGSRGN